MVRDVYAFRLGGVESSLAEEARIVHKGLEGIILNEKIVTIIFRTLMKPQSIIRPC